MIICCQTNGKLRVFISHALIEKFDNPEKDQNFQRTPNQFYFICKSKYYHNGNKKEGNFNYF